MCRLLGFLGAPDAALLDAFGRLARTGALPPGADASQPHHAEGWGLGTYREAARASDGLQPYVERSIGAPDASKDYARACKAAVEARSPLTIVHLRRPSKLAPTGMPDPHPYHYRQYLFAHNGGIRGYAFAPGQPLDSQWLCEHLLDAWYDPLHAIKQTKATLAEVYPEGYSALNFLLADGESLWAYRDFDERVAGFDAYYTLHWAHTRDGGYVVSSEPLGEAHQWHAIAPRTLMVFGRASFATR